MCAVCWVISTSLETFVVCKSRTGDRVPLSSSALICVLLYKFCLTFERFKATWAVWDNRCCGCTCVQLVCPMDGSESWAGSKLGTFFFVSFPFFILSWAFFCQVSSPRVWLWMGGEGWATGSSTCIDLQRSKTSPWDSFMPLKLVSTTDYCRKIKKNFRTTCLIYCALESLYSHVYFPYFIVGTAI